MLCKCFVIAVVKSLVNPRVISGGLGYKKVAPVINVNSPVSLYRDYIDKCISKYCSNKFSCSIFRNLMPNGTLIRVVLK